LVTGGAGYIGSHVVRQLGETAEKVIILDNLVKGFRQAVTTGELVVGDVGDLALVSRLITENEVNTVMHFAAHTIVTWSMRRRRRFGRYWYSLGRILMPSACRFTRISAMRGRPAMLWSPSRSTTGHAIVTGII
jgi:UDP-glucose 4-epimerase